MLLKIRKILNIKKTIFLSKRGKLKSNESIWSVEIKCEDQLDVRD